MAARRKYYSVVNSIYHDSNAFSADGQTLFIYRLITEAIFITDRKPDGSCATPFRPSCSSVLKKNPCHFTR